MPAKEIEVPVYDPNKPPVFSVEQVRAMLPHRYPFLMVDKIIEVGEDYIVGVKNITINEELFQGHFPSNAIFPGVLQIEALAQTGGILVLKDKEDRGNWDTYFAKIDKVKFKQKVVPGDSLILRMTLLSPVRRGVCHMKAEAFVGNKLVSEGELVAQIVERT